MDTKKLIKSKLKLISEARIDPHFLDRLKSRVLAPAQITVGYEVGVGQYRKVGTYSIPTDIKQRILGIYNLIVEKSFPFGKSYGIKMADLKIDPMKIQFAEGYSKESIAGFKIVMVDDATNSNGDVIYCIVRDNKAITMYFAKSYSRQTPEKMRVDVIIETNEDFKRATGGR